ncbi:type VI secretion system amidase effector protein Tae4 [Chryseobacterium oryctis]|uniref:Type VI secretion system amidase effector protein Tae4 n=1 Tax=Chryseobacterium oryctis TaxID=2952618 RepID=A0ABT3HJV8_9FLAO|nr:type VI secretion system amidase effector protein Tae4 [Chryseobacterium oryctis]MCW3160080.1 type VI secretion system amidase effector protein Tae4 [Chryseobacterium oryctis]
MFPCNKSVHQNQCAIRMSVALSKSGVDIMSFGGVKCWEKHEDGFKHILRAQELADWINIHPEIFGKRLKMERKKYPKMNSKSFKHKGIVFIKDGWSGGVDHIDLWDGIELKGGTSDYFEKGVEIWFWFLI